jgi:4-hydroxybenzoate polyprenyltransferase
MFILIKILRPYQWIKNLFCFAGIVFGGRLFEQDAFVTTTIIFLLFSLIASAIYIFNDIADRQYDRLHPIKRNRPIASGKVSVPTAMGLGIFLSLAGIIGAYLLHFSVFIVVILYIFNNILYSAKLKHIPILDVFIIASGFILRLLSGIYALEIDPTAWVLLCTFFLALFLGFAKRRTELFKSEEGLVVQQRPVLARYSIPFLDSLINDAGLLTIVNYAMFATLSGKNSSLIITVPIVCFAIMHYKQMIIMHCKGEEPEKMILNDWKMLLSIITWLITFILIFYLDLKLFNDIG